MGDIMKISQEEFEIILKSQENIDIEDIGIFEAEEIVEVE